MKTDINGLLKAVSDGVDSLVSDLGEKGFTPQLGTALGGLRTAVAGMKGHLEVEEKAKEENEG